MAAGWDNVLRRRESYKYRSNKEFDHYGNGSSGVAVHRRHVTYKNGRRSSDFEDSEFVGKKLLEGPFLYFYPFDGSYKSYYSPIRSIYH